MINPGHDTLDVWGRNVLSEWSHRVNVARVTAVSVDSEPIYGGDDHRIGDQITLTLSYDDTDGQRRGWTMGGSDALRLLNQLFRHAGWAG